MRRSGWPSLPVSTVGDRSGSCSDDPPACRRRSGRYVRVPVTPSLARTTALPAVAHRGACAQTRAHNPRPPPAASGRYQFADAELPIVSCHKGAVASSPHFLFRSIALAFLFGLADPSTAGDPRDVTGLTRPPRHRVAPAVAGPGSAARAQDAAPTRSDEHSVRAPADVGGRRRVEAAAGRSPEADASAAARGQT